MKNKFVYTLIVFCLGFGSPAWSAEETADSTLLGTLFNATMFQPNSSDSLTYARHKKTFSTEWAMSSPNCSASSTPPTRTISSRSIITIQ